MSTSQSKTEWPAQDDVVALPADDGQEASWHQWSQREIDALTVARAAGRPLLLRGEPGTGKTQLARAAAQALGRSLLVEVIHPRYEAADLVCRFDAVQRLADAQARKLQPDTAYWHPGPLWQAYDWASAVQHGHCRGRPQPPGVVILLDEIDKADSDLPNSLLGVLGQRRLYVPALEREVGADSTTDALAAPLVLVTTNEERELPAAFLRRCVVLNLDVDVADGSFSQWLLQRGRAHYGPLPKKRPQALLPDDVMALAAQQLAEDRQRAHDAGLPKPGAAEYLDLLRVLHRLAPGNADGQRRLIGDLSAYLFVKNAHQPGDGLPTQRRLAVQPAEPASAPPQPPGPADSGPGTKPGGKAARKTAHKPAQRGRAGPGAA